MTQVLASADEKKGQQKSIWLGDSRKHDLFFDECFTFCVFEIDRLYTISISKVQNVKHSSKKNVFFGKLYAISIF